MIAITTMITTRRPPTAPPTYKDAFASLFCFGLISEKNAVHLMKNQGMEELILSGTNEFVVGKFRNRTIHCLFLQFKNLSYIAF